MTAARSGPCSVQPAGACIARSCPLGDGGMPATARTNVDAGTVTLTGPKGAMPLVAGGSGAYSLDLGSDKPWEGGEMFTMTVTGGVAPAFTVALVGAVAPAHADADAAGGGRAAAGGDARRWPGGDLDADVAGDDDD